MTNKYTVIETKKSNFWVYFLIVLFLLLAGGCYFMYTKWQNEKAKAEIGNTLIQNQKALNDSLRVIKDKFDELASVTTAYMLSIEDLKISNKVLSNQIKALGPNVISAITNNLSFEKDSIKVDNKIEKYSDTEFGLAFSYEYSDPGMKQCLSGVSKFGLESNVIFPRETEFFDNQLELNILYGFREIDGKYEVFAKSLSPNIKFNELEGVLVLDKYNKVITQKTTRFAFGPIGGVGYSIINNKVDLIIGFGVIYKLGEF